MFWSGPEWATHVTQNADAEATLDDFSAAAYRMIKVKPLQEGKGKSSGASGDSGR